MTLEQIHARAFQFQVRRRNRIEYLASAFVILAFSAYVVFLPDPVLKIASALVVLGTLYVAFQLHRRGSAQPTPAAEDALAFHRAELLRQRDALRSAWRWYLLPFAPGLGLFMVGLARTLPEDAWALKLLTPALAVAYAVFWIWINRRASLRLDDAIAEIDALRRD